MKTSFGNKILLCAATVALGILSHATAQAQLGGVPLWTNSYFGMGGIDGPAAIVVDGSGNVLVTGYSLGSGNYDYATIKYSNAGLPIWTNRYDGPANRSDGATAMAVDGNGNVFVTGYSWGSGDSSSDWATVAYSGLGAPLWTNRFNASGRGYEYARGVGVDHDGNVYVTGESTANNGHYDYATIKYSGLGVPLWTNRYHGPGIGDDVPWGGLAVDHSGNVFITGGTTGTNGFPDFGTIKYSASGVALWTNRYDGPAHKDDTAYHLALDSVGNVFVTGQSTATNGFLDIVTIKYSGSGLPLWTNRYNGSGNDYEYATGLAMDNGGNALVTSDHVTLNYSGAGLSLWTNRYNGLAKAVAVDADGNVFVTGYSLGTSGGNDYLTIGYSRTGLPLWTNRWDGGYGDDAAQTVAVDGSGNVFVTGSSSSSDGSRHYVTIGYSSAVRPSLIITSTPKNTVALSWPSPSTGFTLQQNTNGLATANWSNVVTTPSDDGTSKSVIVDPPSGNRFYRLFHP